MTRFTLSDWYEFSDEQGEIDGFGFIRLCRDWAWHVLEQAGVEHRPYTAAEFAELRSRFEPESWEAIAIGLGIAASQLKAYTIALEAKVPSEAISDIIQLSAIMAQSYDALVACERGMPQHASRGKKQLQGLAKASAAGAAASRNEDWRAMARELWRNQPTLTLNKVAQLIAQRFGTVRRPVDPSSVRRAIRSLVPPTSPSFRGGQSGGVS